jgi:hypothetical protein
MYGEPTVVVMNVQTMEATIFESEDPEELAKKHRAQSAKEQAEDFIKREMRSGTSSSVFKVLLRNPQSTNTWTLAHIDVKVEKVFEVTINP